jgi:hypothetical protein
VCDEYSEYTVYALTSGGVSMVYVYIYVCVCVCVCQGYTLKTGVDICSRRLCVAEGTSEHTECWQ